MSFVKISSYLREMAASNGGSIPRRTLGKTGLEVSILGLGGGALVGLKGKEHDRKAEDLVQRSIELGINYIDTAPEYGPSEARVGAAVGSNRPSVILATKTQDRTRDGSLRLLEASLKALRTDYVDVWQIHHIDHADEVKAVLAKGGALEALEEAKSQGMTKYIGVTGHYDPRPLASLIKRHDFDTALLAMNAADVHGAHSFIEKVLPEATTKGMGVVCMKVTSMGRIFNPWNINNMKDALYYCLSLPVATAIVGVDDADQLMENVVLAKAFEKLSRSEMNRIEDLTKDYHEIANFFRKGNEDHNPFWKPYSARSKKASDALPDVLYHGTTAEIAMEMEKDGLLKPGKQTGRSQWSGGPFGGNPSDSNLVYAAVDREIAVDYAKQISNRSGSNGAVVVVRPEWDAAMPDEDTIAEIVHTQTYDQSPLNAKVFKAHAKALGFKSPEDVQKFFSSEEGQETLAEKSDSQIAQDMKDTVRELQPMLTPTEFKVLTAGTVAFSKPLKILRVELIKSPPKGKTANEAKRLIILRGISGTGKSTLAASLEREHGVKALSSDEFFMRGGKYDFNRDLVPQAHKWNHGRADKAMGRGEPVVIVDNTNTQAWEMKPYVLSAKKHGYSVEFREPDWSPRLRDERGRWNVDFIEQMQKSKERTDIGKVVPRDRLEKMRDFYQYGVTEEDVLKSQMPDGIG
jgi:predicted aldo/keto reductase-like oxidoreductase/predicted kinase